MSKFGILCAEFLLFNLQSVDFGLIMLLELLQALLVSVECSILPGLELLNHLALSQYCICSLPQFGLPFFNHFFEGQQGQWLSFFIWSNWLDGVIGVVLDRKHWYGGLSLMAHQWLLLATDISIGIQLWLLPPLQVYLRIFLQLFPCQRQVINIPILTFVASRWDNLLARKLVAPLVQLFTHLQLQEMTPPRQILYHLHIFVHIACFAVRLHQLVLLSRQLVLQFLKLFFDYVWLTIDISLIFGQTTPSIYKLFRN